MKYFIFTILLLIPFAARADEARYKTAFTSANGKYELKLTDKNWSLIEKETSKELYRLAENNLWSMTVLISDDGKSVVAIDDYSEREPAEIPEVLIFYQNGKKIAAYKLDELLDNPKFIMRSASHFRWLYRNEKAFSINDAKLNLTTFEMNDLVFDVETGRILKKDRDEILSGEAIYVFGKVKGLGGDNHEIEVLCVIYGAVKKGDKIQFRSEKYKWEAGFGFYDTLIIKDGKLADKKGVIFNVCN
jgi:hypothetical protein